MELLLIGVVALLASGLTFFSGFGLGTLLTPVFLLFFPPLEAIAMTAVVHFVNNIFKFGLMAKSVAWPLILKFGVPAIFGAFIGAKLLTQLSEYDQVLYRVPIGAGHDVTTINFIIGLLILFFALFELNKRLKSIRFGNKSLVPGGLLSGFFGGLSGHQGALRSAFLVRADIDKNTFIATGITIALMVDMARISIYSGDLLDVTNSEHILPLGTALGAALVGALIGRWLLTKVTINILQQIVGILLAAIGFALMLGLI